MITNISRDYNEMCQAVSDHLVAYINKKPESLLCLPGGDTPLGIFKCFIEAVRTKQVDISRCTFVSLDEWGSLGYETKGSCIQTLYDCLYNELAIDADRQVCFFNGKAIDFKAECKREDDFIFKQGGIDIAVLGIGMNGHIGFNEPGVDPEQYCTVVDLDEVTKSVSVKYFGEQLNLKQGITIGMKHFYEAEEVILIADDSRKADIVKRVVEGDISNEVPASLMRKAKNCMLYMDEAASSKLA